MSEFQEILDQNIKDTATAAFQRHISTLVQSQQYVGDVFNISYDTVLVQVHDKHRGTAGGIPSGGFLLATRLVPGGKSEPSEEDSCLILLRVLNSCNLPQSDEATRVRLEAAQRVAGRTDVNWDASENMDVHTNDFLSFAGLECKILGTFYFSLQEGKNDDVRLCFGSDIANFYPNQGLKVYKPIKGALEKIVNFSDEKLITDPRLAPYHTNKVRIGRVRYSSTDRPDRDNPEDAHVWLHPANLLAQKTAVYGMSRTGKSNTVKVIAKSVFDLRYQSSPLRVGQIVFDFNGEYANDNKQDRAGLFNVWRENFAGNESDVVRYGLRPHPADPGRKIMKLNFFEDSLLEMGKQVIDASLESESSQYFRNFAQVRFEPPTAGNFSKKKRYDRRVFVYKVLLSKASFETPQRRLSPKGLFNADLLAAMKNTQNPELETASTTLGQASEQGWGELQVAVSSLAAFVLSKAFKDDYTAFERTYVDSKKKEEAETWADQDLKNILGMFLQSNGSARIADVREQHTTTVSNDYADEIYKALHDGKLVIVDQSAGTEETKLAGANRVMNVIFRKNFNAFVKNEIAPDILVYAEEAHNLLPAGNDLDLKNIWVRTSKEGAKCNIGMVYITQEPSSIQKNIVKNTANLFVAHLNNEDEIKEVSKYYDIADFSKSIRRAADRGFVRFKSLTTPFTVPIMVDKFEIQFKENAR